MKLAIGDKVRYSLDWLMSVGMRSNPAICKARGTIVELTKWGNDVSSTRIAKIDWNGADMPEKVNTANLTKVRSK